MTELHFQTVFLAMIQFTQTSVITALENVTRSHTRNAQLFQGKFSKRHLKQHH